jgi:hypothetical protein
MDTGKNTVLLDAHTLSTLREISAMAEDTRAAQARLAATVRDIQQDSADLKALGASIRELQDSGAAFNEQLKNATPALRALTLLLRKIPAAGDMPAREALALVRAIAHEFQRTHGARGGKERAQRSQTKARQYQATWEDARARGVSVSAATAQTAQAHGIKSGQVRKLRHEARQRGAPWSGDKTA